MKNSFPKHLALVVLFSELGSCCLNWGSLAIIQLPKLAEIAYWWYSMQTFILCHVTEFVMLMVISMFSLEAAIIGTPKPTMRAKLPSRMGHLWRFSYEPDIVMWVINNGKARTRIGRMNLSLFGMCLRLWLGLEQREVCLGRESW